jgi:hypothetical protein
MIHGVGRDAERIVKVIHDRIRSGSPDVKNVEAGIEAGSAA